MLNFKVHIRSVQHINEFTFELDLTNNILMAIVGKNGVGKTLLFKAIQNLITSNTFATTSNKHIFNEKSKINYIIDSEQEYRFVYNSQVETIDFKGSVDESILKDISVELPIPYGERFEFRRFGDIDSELRKNIISQQYSKPTELIELLNFIYDTERFDELIEVEIKAKKYYAIVLPDDYYIREDYLSSGEYFIISIYKLIQKRCKLIVIDEIDISLDAMAQVRFIQRLRELLQRYEINLLFTTHSLGIMKTLQSNELFYMESENGSCSIENRSYNYIKSLLYGFIDYDKYLLVEDEVLKEFIEFTLEGERVFPKYIILPIGGADNVVNLMHKNSIKKIFSNVENVLSILDGDVKSIHESEPNVVFLPFESIEKELFEHYKVEKFIILTEHQKTTYQLQNTKAKTLYKVVIRENIKTKYEIFEYLKLQKNNEVEQFKAAILNFLNQ
jgi:ABC-type dipeptide/oligopeptide/nickel transport system ATPase component